MNPLLKRLLEQRAEAQAAIDTAVDAADKEERSELNETEAKSVVEARARIADLDPRIAELVEDEKRAKAAADLAKTAEDLGAQSRQAPAVVKSEARTYSEDAERTESRSFIADMYAATALGSFSARDRLDRHMQEELVERRASTTANFTGVVIPQYLIDQFAPIARAGRPTANAIGSMDLPDKGVSFNLSAGTTGTVVSAQNGENTAGGNATYDDTATVVNVATISGYTDISKQSVDRGYGADQLVVRDLVSAYHTELDRQVVNGSGSSGEMLGILNTSSIISVAYTDATPTVPELYGPLNDAIQRVNTQRFAPADLIVMHPRRWGWILAKSDTNNRPFVLPSAAYGRFNSIGTGQAAAYDGSTANVVGEIGGLPVVTDANVPTNLGTGTNEDRIVIARTADYVLMEDRGAPLTMTVDQVGAHTLTVRFVIYGYALFTAARYPKATAVISDTGLVTPTF